MKNWKALDLSFAEFLPFCILSGLWNFSVMVAGPFSPIYVVEGLKTEKQLLGLPLLWRFWLPARSQL
jgi:hypothetical protein